MILLDDHRVEGAEGPLRLLPAHRRRRGAHVRRGPHPRLVLPPRGRPSTDAILTCRLIDRPLRPTFVDGLRNEIQVIETILAQPQRPLRRRRDQRRIGVDADRRPAVLRPGRWRPRRAHPHRREQGWPVGRVPDRRAALRRRVQHGRRGRIASGEGDNADVAIMMVEAEATDNVLELIAGGAQAPTEEIVAEGLEAAKPFIVRLCEGAEAPRRGRREGDRRVPAVPAVRGRRVRGRARRGRRRSCRRY